MYSVIFPFVVICVLKANHGHDTSHVYPSEVLFLWQSPALHISASVKRRVFGSGHTSIFFFLFCAGSRKRHSCGPVGQSHYRPCHLFEGFGAVASKRYQLIRLDSLRSCAGMWKEPNSCEHHKFMRTLWPALKLRITSGTSQQHAKCGCCKWEVAAVENSGDTLWRHVVETRCGDTLCHHFYPVDWCR